MKKMINFYDTSSLLLKADYLFENENEYFAISSITLEELEHIKTSANKDSDIKYAARKLLKILDKFLNKYLVVIYSEKPINNLLKKYGLSNVNNDSKILGCALNLKEQYNYDVVFYTNDLNLKQLALCCNFSNIASIEEEVDDYVRGLAPVLQKNTMGYGLWVYRNYVNNCVYNGQFGLDFTGWSYGSNDRVLEIEGDHKAVLAKDGMISQKITGRLNYAEEIQVEFWAEPTGGSAKLEVSLG